MVRTGAHGYLAYDFHTDGTFSSGGNPDKKFGLQDKLSSLSVTNNKIALNALNQNTVQTFAYGQHQATASVSFILANPWIFGALLNSPKSTVQSGSLYKHEYPSPDNSNALKTPRTVTMAVNFDGASTDLVRTFKGGLVNNLNISTSVGNAVECTVDLTFGEETAPSTTLGAVPSNPSKNFPYTFAHAELRFGGSLVAQCQDANLSIAQNSELLYGLNSHKAIDSFRKVLEITGSFRAAWVDKTKLENVLNQISGGTAGTFTETVGGTPEFRLIFNKTNSIDSSGTFTPSDESIEITLSGLTINDLGISGFEPVEPIFEEINWQAKTITVKAYTTLTSEP